MKQKNERIEAQIKKINQEHLDETTRIKKSYDAKMAEV